MKNTAGKKIAVILLTLILAVPSMAAFAEADAVQTKVIRVGFFAFDGYHIQDEDGIRSGYGYDFLQMAARYNDWTYEYVGYDKSWAEMLEMLENGEIDLLTSAQKSEERLEKFDFSASAIGTSATIFTTKAGNSKLVAGDCSTYNGVRVGMLRNSSRNDSFARFALQNRFVYTPVYYDEISVMERDLQAGENIDAILTSSLRAVSDEWVLDRFDASGFYAMVKKGDKILLKELNYAISQMDIYSAGWRTLLDGRYYATDSGEAVSFVKEEKKYIQDLQDSGKVLQVAMNPDLAPYSYFENGEAKGIIPTIFKEAASRIGLNYQIVEVANREEYGMLIESGKIDIDLNSRMDFDGAEKHGLKLTDEFMTTTVSRLTRRENIDDISCIAIVNRASVSNDYEKDLFSQMDFIQYGSVAECVESVLNGETDATYLYTYTAQQLVQTDVRNRLAATILPEYVIDLTFGVRADTDHRLLSVLNKAVRNLKGSYAKSVILAQTTEIAQNQSVMALLYKHPLASVTLVGICFGMLCLILIYVGKARHAEREKLQSEELARFMGYVCKSNDMVMEVDLSHMLARRHVLQGDRVVSITEPYHFFNDNNYGTTIYPEDYAKIQQTMTEKKMDDMIARGDGEVYFECRARNDAGEYVWYSYTIRTIPKDKKHPRNFILFKKNINSIKQAEEEQRQVLMDALETARRASQAKGTFLSRMSHEIRTPLNAVIGYMSIAKSSQDNVEKIMHCVDNSETAAKHLLDLINDVLDISSIESGKMKIASEDFDLKKQITTVSTIFFNQARGKGVVFDAVLNDVTEEWVVGDRLRVNQILMNLLSNAVKFTPQNGHVTLTVSQMKCTQDTVHMKFVVSDTGIGMSEEYKNRLFKPFEQESATTAQRFGGTGLGLSITNNLVHLMGGSIDVQSRQGEGTTFVVTLCFKRSSENKKASVPDVQDYSKLRALVVDDEKSTCEYVKSLLKRCGVKSDTVLTGEAAIKQIQRRMGTDYAYDLCIMDWNMPGMNGIETARRIRSECDKDLPIIIATAYDTTEFEDEAKSVGICRVISKPLFQSTMFDLLVSTYGKYQPAATDQTTSSAELKGIRVLLAEDNEMNMEIAVDILEKAGILVDTAVDGQKAYDKFAQSAPDTYQAILMDIQMPVLNGYQATGKIRACAHPQAKTVPIIAMTANAFSEDVAEALASGMNDHISKPIDYGKLFKVLKKFIEKEQ